MDYVRYCKSFLIHPTPSKILFPSYYIPSLLLTTFWFTPIHSFFHLVLFCRPNRLDFRPCRKKTPTRRMSPPGGSPSTPLPNCSARKGSDNSLIACITSRSSSIPTTPSRWIYWLEYWRYLQLQPAIEKGTVDETLEDARIIFYTIFTSNCTLFQSKWCSSRKA